MGVGLAICEDIDEIRSVFTHPDIWATIAEDNQTPDEFTVDLSSEMYVAVLVDGLIIGFYAFRAINGIELDIHAQILPDYRKKYALASGKLIIDWVFDNLPECHKLTAQIPFLYPNVKEFALKQGLQVEGVNRSSYRKNGKIYNQWHLGITRQDYELGKR